MPLVPTPKNCDPSVKKAVQILTQKLGLKSVPIHANLTLTDLTASSIVGTNASKLLESVTIGTGLDYTRPTLSFSHLGIENLTDPGADRIFFWDNSASASKWLAVGNSIVITTTTIDTIQDIRTTASPTFTQLTLSKICTIAAGLNVLRVTGLQTDGTAMTGTLRGAYIDVSNGSTAATGTIRGMELKARTEAPGDTGNDVNVLEGLSISADSKGHSVTTMRAAEFILDGKTGGTITEAVGLRIANNLQANKATTSYGLQIYRDSFDYTADIQLSSGGLIGGSGGDLFITDVGKVGIGTTSPTSKLHVETSAWNNSGVPMVSIINMDSHFVDSKALFVRGGADNTQLTIEVQDYSGNTDFVITGLGKVGIGTNSPGRKLDIGGTANAYQEFHATDHNQWVIGSESRGFVFYDDTTDDYRMVVQNGTGRVGIGVSTGLDPRGGLTVLGDVDILHTAIDTDDHAFEIDLDAAGKGDVKAIDIVYVSGDIGAGEDEEAILVNVDESASGPGDVAALEVLTTAVGSAKIFGLEVGINVIPIEQLSGTFGDMAKAENDGVDALGPFTTSGSGDPNNVEIFVANGDTVLIGNTAKFEEIEFIFETFSNPSVKPTFEFSTGGTGFSPFTPADGTNGMRNNGVVLWLDSDIPSWATNTGNNYEIRITRTRNTLATTPREDFIKIGTAVEYVWDADGDVNINSLTLATGIELGHASDTTITRVSAGVIAVEGTTVMMVGGAPTAHSIASHNDTTGTGAELNTLTGGGDVGALHTHAAAYQPLDAELTSLAALSYVAASFVKMTGANTFALRTIGETADDLEGTIDHNSLANYAANQHYLQSAITTVGTIATGVWEGTDVGIAHGGTGQSTAQLAINALSAVSGATNEHVLTKDTGTGNAIWKAAGAGASTWIALTDTDPANYTGQAGNTVVVNVGEDGLEFGAAPGGTFTSKCSVYRNATQSIPTASHTKIEFNTENYDTDGEFDNASDYQFKPTAAGYYHITAQVWLSAIGVAKATTITIRKNGTEIGRSAVSNMVPDYLPGPVSKDVYLNGSTDYIEIFCYHTSGVNRNTVAGNNNTYLDIHRFA